LQDGQTVLGIWSIVASPTLVEIGAAAGFDFHILDLEHGAYDMGSLEEAIRAAEGGGSAPLVRVPDLTASTFQKVLDLGAHGIIAPQVKSARDAEMVVQYAKYAPRGVRGYNPFTRAANYAAPMTNQHGKLDRNFGLLGVIVENRTAYEELADICAVPELGLIYLGIYDMSLVLGCEGDTRHPRVQQFVADAARQVRTAGKTLGLMARNEAEMLAATQLGAKFLVYGVDSHVAYQAFEAPVQYLKKKHHDLKRGVSAS
jgi:4-hydroxy-2-oxoheptanedioate aldolase